MIQICLNTFIFILSTSLFLVFYIVVIVIQLVKCTYLFTIWSNLLPGLSFRLQSKWNIAIKEYLTNVCLSCLLACLLDIVIVSYHFFHKEHICTCSSLAKYSLVRIYNITISHNKRSGNEQNLCDVKIILQLCPVSDTLTFQNWK